MSRAITSFTFLMHRFCPDVHFNTGHSNEIISVFKSSLYPFDTCIAIVETLCRLHSDLCYQYSHHNSTCQNIIFTGLDVPVMPVQSRREMARASINTRQADAGVNGNLAVTTLRKVKDIEHRLRKKELLRSDGYFKR